MTRKHTARHVVQSKRWRKALSLPLVLAFLLGPFLGLQVTPASADGWVIECVDCPKKFSEMTDRSLRLDAAGHPHIAYGRDHLYYAWYDGADWHYETADDSPNVGWYASLALDGHGYPHISYSGGGHLKYAYQDAYGWHIETVDSEGGVYTSLALDGDGYPHISHYGNDNLKYAYQDASGWYTETVDSEGDVGGYTSLALDGGGYPHISYYYCGTSYPCDVGDLKYAYQDTSGWHTQTVDSEGDVGYDTSLALDGEGYPHISYYYCGTWRHGSGCDVGDLRYAYHDGYGWHIQTVDSEGYVGRYTSLALDGDGYPHISYYYCGTVSWLCEVSDLKYAYQDAAGWHIETVDSEGGMYTSLALDGDGYPRMSYYDDFPNCDLKYGYQDASGWYTETVDSEASVGRFTSLALDGNGYPHISYYDDLPNWDLKYAHQDASGWHIETVDSEAEVGWSTSLALDGGGYPHISYPGGGLRYAYQDDSGWHIETVDSEGGAYTSLALDQDGYPHISYLGGTDGHLKYAYQDSSGWYIETVDSDEYVGYSTSLALDRDGYPYISYYDSSNADLKYARQHASGWHIQTVDSEGGGHTSLALNGDGYPHISYYDGTNADLKYAHQDASGWHIEIVDSEGNVGSDTSLALGGDGYPHISYYYCGTRPVGYVCDVGDLKYAYHHASGWHIETVDSVGSWFWGDHTSLTLDEGGHAHISYYDETNEDLKYAYAVPWIRWRDPDRLLLPPLGTTVDVVYRNIPTPATLTATLAGPALFADGSQVLTATIASANGSYALLLKPAAGATPGITFTLEVTLDDLRLERVGVIAWEVYLPLILKETP